MVSVATLTRMVLGPARFHTLSPSCSGEGWVRAPGVGFDFLTGFDYCGVVPDPAPDGPDAGG